MVFCIYGRSKGSVSNNQTNGKVFKSWGVKTGFAIVTKG